MSASNFLAGTLLVGLLPVGVRAQTLLADHLDLLGVDDAEITPDGRYIVARDNTIQTSTYVYDAATGAELFHHMTVAGSVSGVCQDAVAVTDQRAAVLGSECVILDLTNLANPVMASYDLGLWPRDLAITPDGALLAVRAGSAPLGGLFVFDLATGAQLWQGAGQPRPWQGAPVLDVDSVAVTDEHAVFTSVEGSGPSEQTVVTIVDLHAAGGVPAVVFETASGTGLLGAPYDVAITPDGQYAAVRSEMAVGLYRLDGLNSARVWGKRLWGNPGPFGGSAMDSIEVTNERVATISRFSNGGIGAQVDVFDIAGNQKFQVIDGDPHDLAITPSGQRLVVRTHTDIYLYDLQNLPAGLGLSFLDREPLASTHTSYGAGMDSILATDTRAVAVARNNDTSRVRFYDIGDDEIVQTMARPMPDRPTDVQITPDESKVVVSGLTYVMIFDLVGDALLLAHDPAAQGGYPWCDGVVANNDTAAAFGYLGPNFQGWISILDLFGEPLNFCSATPNSTGSAAGMYATGSASVSANDLRIVARDVPAGNAGAFVYGDTAIQTPFGSGFLCAGGQSWLFDIQMIGAEELAQKTIDNTNLPAGGAAITAGSTWYFQFLYRDVAGATTNTSDGLEVVFQP